MHYSDLITVYFERSTAIQNYWTLYVVVIGGLLAVASLRHDRDVLAGALATVLFLAFSYKNLGAIVEASNSRDAILAAIHQAPVPAEGAFARQIESTLQPPSIRGVRAFHAGCAALTVVTMWGLQWRRARRVAEPRGI